MSAYDAEANDEQLALNLIDELRDQAKMRNFAYKQRVAKYYNSRVKPCAFKLGDWVMRKTLLATKNSAKVLPQINMSRSLPSAPIFSHYSYAFGTYVLCFTKLPMYVYLSAST